MSDLIQTYGELRGTTGAPSGRHALDEDAALTPIFTALSRAGSRAAPRSPEAVDEFHRDPLTAPIPVQALVAAAGPARYPAGTTGRRSGRRRARPDSDGRHALLAG